MKTHFMGVIFTNHAIDRLYHRGITQSDAYYTFCHPDGQSHGSTSGSYRYYKDYNGQRIEVIAKKNDEGKWVILSAWSKVVGTGKSLFPKQESLWFLLLKFFWKKIFPIRNKK